MLCSNKNYLGPWTYKWEQAHKDKEPKKADSAAQAADPKTNDANPETKDADPEASEAEANDKPTAGGKTGGKTGGKAGGKKQIAKRGKKQAGEAKEDEDLDADDVEPEEEDEDSGEVDPRSIAPYTMPNGGVAGVWRLEQGRAEALPSAARNDHQEQGFVQQVLQFQGEQGPDQAC